MVITIFHKRVYKTYSFENVNDFSSSCNCTIAILINNCFYYVPSNNEYAINATNNIPNNDWTITGGGEVIDIFEGINFINSVMKDCNNQTDRQLVKWKLDGNGLPTYDELPSTSSIISSGNIWIIVIGIVVIIGGTTIIINKKKNKVAHI